MKSTKVQLLVTLAAVIASAGVFALRGLPPQKSLLRATSSRDIDQVRRAVFWGADTNVKDSRGLTPLHSVAWGDDGDDDREIADLLIVHGADVNAKSPQGATPLHQAAACDQKEVVKMLIAAGADVKAKDSSGLTPLHMAAGAGCRDTAELLIFHGADVNARDIGRGLTPLHRAAWEGRTNVVELLIAHGAEINAKADGRWTPLFGALHEPRGPHRETADLLRQHGAGE